MLGQDGPVPAPAPATLRESPGRVTELAFALGDPERVALLGELSEGGGPLAADELAERLRIDIDTARGHLKVLVDAGLAATKRSGLSRKRVYVATVADLELRFFHDAPKTSEHTSKVLARDARRRERQKRRIARKERSITKKARRL